MSQCKHEWSDWTTLTAATCETEGVMTRSCSKCGEKEQKPVSALGHIEVMDKAVDATCTKSGKTEGKHCSRCNKVFVEQEEVKALGHDFANYRYNNDATCLTDGTKTAKCSRCNKTDTVKAENTALGHNEVVDKAIAATCTKTGLTEGKHCSRCNEVLVKQEVVKALGHEEVTDAAVAATCTTSGLTEGKHCSRCNEVLVKKEVVKPLGHAEVTDAAVAATCTTAGLTEGKHCSRCNEVLVKQETVKALGHAEVIDKAVAATCTTTGLTEGKHCSRCNEILVKQEVVKALGHAEVTDAAVAATCTTTGLTEGKHCSRCNEVFVKQEEIPAKGHKYSNEWSSDKKEHWHAAICEHVDLCADRAEHTYNSDYVCTVCNYKDVGLHGTEIASEVFKIDGENLYVSVPNADKEFSFIDTLQLADGAKYSVCTDLQCNFEIRSKTATIEPGDNILYVLVENGKEMKLYKAIIRRRPMYTVKFVVNGGTAVETKQVEEGRMLVVPKTEKKGYTFVSCNYDFNQPITKDTTITASWSLIKYNITYVLNGGTNSSANSATYTIEDNITLSSPTKKGYTFAGWSNGGKIEKGSVGDKTFTASWSPIKYNITYVLNGGTNSSTNSATYTIEDDITLSSPTKKGYTFAGWSNGGKIEKGSVGDKTFTASWSIITYKITYELNGGSTATANKTSYTVEDNITLSSPTKKGYTFAGWSNGGKIEKGSVGDKTFTASWSPIKYNITYVLNGGTNSSTNSATYTIEDDITLSSPTKKGYTFAGWSNGGKIEKGSVGNKTFTASWTLTKYNITYVLNGGTNSSANSATYTIEDNITLSSPTKKGYTFAGWSNGGKIEKGSVGDKTFTASWSADVKLSSDGKTVTGLNNSVTELIILSEYNGVKITSIGGYAFYNGSSLTSITIPNSVTNIGGWAFYNCSSLTSITIPNSVTNIGYDAFRYCSSLTSITIPNSVTSIGSSAFSGCKSLTSITILNSVTSIGSSAFSGCKSLTSITIPNSVTSIGSGAFSGCSSLTSITIPFVGETKDCSGATHFGYIFGADDYKNNNGYIPSSLKTVVITGGESIGDYAFYGCSSLTSITIPNCVTNIGEDAFASCSSLTSITIPFVGEMKDCSGATHFGYIFGAGDYNGNSTYVPTSLKTVVITGGESIGGYAFYKCSNLTGITIPDSVTNIGNYAFYNCSSLTSITIPDSVTSIGWDAFYNCSSLTRVNITDIAAWCDIDFESYYSNPLYYAHNLYFNGEIIIDLVIPDSVTSIGSSAFSGCSSLTSITIPNSVTDIGDYAFLYCSGLTSITIPDNVTNIGKCAFGGCSGLTSVTIPDSVTSIGSGAFSGCRSLTSITIPDSVKSIGDWAFDGCSSLKSITIPDGVTSIGSSAFDGCSSLTSITIPFVGKTKDGSGKTHFGYIFGASDYKGNRTYVPTSLKTVVITGGESIGGYAFYNCSSLTSVTIGNSVTSIRSSAFSGCSSLTSVTIPNGVTSIGWDAFYNCSSLTRVNITDIAAWCNIKFSSYDTNPLYYAHNLYLNGELVTDLVIPDSVTSIGDYAFRGCSSLTSITIPDSVTSIGWFAFEDCIKLKEVNYKGTVEQWDKIKISSGNSSLINAKRNYIK